MTNYLPTESGLSFLLKTLSQYQAPGYYIIVAAVFLVIAAVSGGRRVRTAFLYPLILLILTVFNPYVFPLLLGNNSRFIENYYSVLWIVPITMIPAAGVVSAASRLPHIVPKILLTVFALAVLTLLGTPRLRSYAGTEMPANMMKADAELVTICDYIAADAETDAPVVAFERADFAEEAMAYNPAILISNALYADEGAPSPDAESTEDFFVIRKESSELEKALRSSGYKAIAHTPDSYVFARR